MRLLITRPQPAADKTAAAAKAAGLVPVIMPLFAVRPLPWNIVPAENHDGLLVTSANALRHAGDQFALYQELPLLAVGPATAEAARQKGITVAIEGRNDKASLLAEAKARGFERLLWLAGKHGTGPSSDEDIISARIAVYESVKVPQPEGFRTAVAEADYVAVYSPRAARYFSELCRAGGVDRGQVKIAALSQAVADALEGGWLSVTVAKSPNNSALFEGVCKAGQP